MTRKAQHVAASRLKATEAAQPLPIHPATRKAARAVFALLLLAASIWTAFHFLPALIWSVMLAISLWPLYIKVARWMSHGPSNLSALLFTLLVTLIIVFPLSLTLYQLAEQSGVLSDLIKRAHDTGINVPEWVDHLPIAATQIAQWWRENLAKPESAAAWLQSLNVDSANSFLTAFGSQLIQRLFLLFMSLMVLFVLLRHGEGIARHFLVTADRILGEPGEQLVEKSVVAIRGTMNGTVIVATAEGLLIGVGYILAGVSNPTLFTVLTIAFAMLPFGAWAVFSVAAATLLFTGGSGAAAAALFGWGVIVMLCGDHFVWPTLVGGAARLPFLYAFIGVFGGLASFGLMGLFVGPVIMALLLTVWREWVLRSSKINAGADSDT
ncbi:AI-2E family transporter [Rhodoplanes sp. Z2-YC6860]|uniref:AI-2E family transporter n=1 Tax=Rhodoplanes sp. Z2-YC6860 TaxID=674703 RepID=UPI00078CDD75|nr:AI-2E family transporter [Rhodoplanes sp. Z2-YC6860]AMN40476.1 permease [Rhodoplanes sp. Z2-YC6860]